MKIVLSLIRKLIKFLKYISKLISMLPLVGRIMIKTILFTAYSSKGIKKIKLVLCSYFILILFIVGHSVQAKISYSTFCMNSNIAVKAFMLTYSVINILVIYVQIFLFFRLSKHCLKNRSMFFEKNIKYHLCRDFSGTQTLSYMFITLSGQILFSILK